MDWVSRIQFGGLLDVPDEKARPRSRRPRPGWPSTCGRRAAPSRRFSDLDKIIVRGRLPRAAGEILLGDDLARRLGLEPGGRVTLIGSTMHGAMSMANFTVAGTIRFGDRGPWTRPASSPTWPTSAKPWTWRTPPARSWASSATGSTTRARAEALAAAPSTPGRRPGRRLPPGHADARRASRAGLHVRQDWASVTAHHHPHLRPGHVARPCGTPA